MDAKAEVESKLMELITQGKIPELAVTCEEWEYSCAEYPASKNATPYYSIQMLTYLILNDLNAARFLWRRIPKKLRDSDAELGAAWTIGKHMWRKSYADIYSSIQSYNWGIAQAQLIQHLAEAFRTRTFRLISNAYSTISSADAAVLLGMSEQDTIKLSLSQGWKFDSSTNILSPVPIKPEKVQQTGLDQLQQLTEYVVWLEQK